MNPLTIFLIIYAVMGFLTVVIAHIAWYNFFPPIDKVVVFFVWPYAWFNEWKRNLERHNKNDLIELTIEQRLGAERLKLREFNQSGIEDEGSDAFRAKILGRIEVLEELSVDFKSP